MSQIFKFLIFIFIYINSSYALKIEDVILHSKKNSDEVASSSARISSAKASKLSAFSSNFLPEFSYFYNKNTTNNLIKIFN